MRTSDRIILLISLSFFFFGGCWAMINAAINKKKNDLPVSVMVSLTAEEMAILDPRPKIEEITKLCYSETKFTEFINEETRDNNQHLIARGTMNNNKRIELYTNDQDGRFALYTWETKPGVALEICRIAFGRQMKIFGDGETENIPDLSPEEPADEETPDMEDGIDLEPGTVLE